VQCGRPLLLRQAFAPEAFDQVILGCVNVIADEMNPARVAALRLGMGEAMTAFTVQINCGSGMQSIDIAYRYIRARAADLILDQDLTGEILAARIRAYFSDRERLARMAGAARALGRPEAAARIVDECYALARG